jgi:hypothetical protein
MMGTSSRECTSCSSPAFSPPMLAAATWRARSGSTPFFSALSVSTRMRVSGWGSFMYQSTSTTLGVEEKTSFTCRATRSRPSAVGP